MRGAKSASEILTLRADTKYQALACSGEKNNTIMNNEETEEINIENITHIIEGMSHDMRSPLTTIGGFTELLLKNDAIQGESREYLHIILDESRKISKILAKFLSDVEAKQGGREIN